MSEQPAPFESQKSVDLTSEKIFNRLARLFADIDRLAIDWNEMLAALAPEVAVVSRQQFNEICHRISVRPETLIEISDDLFEETYQEIVAIIKKRRSYDLSED